MRLLVVTQGVDLDDPVLGFFHAWLLGLAAHSATVEAICLKEGRHHLPANVRVHSLGKERGRKNKLIYALHFFALAWRLRSRYDAVLVHMNEEYILIFGWLWRVLGKRVVLWRNHKMGTYATVLAAKLAHTVCYTSPSAYVTRFPHAVQMPVGIDTEYFIPPATPAAPDSVLFLGRLDPVKKVEVFVDALRSLHEAKAVFRAESYGAPTIPGDPYALQIKRSAEPLVAAGKLVFHGAVKNEDTPKIYASHAIYANLTPSGSFDKTIGEAMACGCIVVCVNDALREAVRPGLLAKDGDAEDVARALNAALSLSPEERAAESKSVRAYVEENHSLTALLGKLDKLLRA